MKQTTLLSILLFLIATSNLRADFNNGVVAYLSGNYDQAYTTMQSLAETTDHDYAQYFMGVMLLEGRGVKKDLENASKWLRKAAEKGIAPAQYRLGELYMNGQGVPKDYEFAYAWLSTGATQQHKKSIALFGKVESRLSGEELEEAKKLATSFATKYIKTQAEPNQSINLEK